MIERSRIAVNLAYDLPTSSPIEIMDPSSYQPALLFLLPLAKLIVMAFAAYPLYVCWWRFVDTLGQKFRPDINSILPSESREDTSKLSFSMSATLFWGFLFVCGFLSFCGVITEMAITIRS
ncbi:hypothetical protein J2T08_003675 [Neorhizobium galegae]|uniref:hypothetical protein n=1 Tax=Neorhizobium galegae TaxID=399 RepID=UPI001AEB957A|nr:hypothetical protein [Neorhizobium galegae]MBP2558738.1 hypothetical protein [Neorhizobium galegae]MDQ0135754.1 hypothetical protein [Neorhizobium galegae]